MHIGTNLQTSKRPGIPTSARPLRSIDGLSPGAKALVDAFVAARRTEAGQSSNKEHRDNARSRFSKRPKVVWNGRDDL